MATVTSTFRQGVNNYTGTLDTMLKQASPSAAFGTATTMRVDAGTGVQVQSLLAFDNLFGSGAGQIPLGATITSATLTLQTTNGSGNAGALHRMLADWTGASTWTSLTNGVQTDGAEAVATPDVTVGSVSTGSRTFDVTNSLQAWATAGTTAEAHNAANQGWLFKAGGTDGWDFYSSEGATKPLLSVTYTTDGTPPPPPPVPKVTIQTGSPNPQKEGAGAPISFAVTLDTAASQEIIVEYRTVVTGAAVAGQDFVAEAGSISIPANATSAASPITIDLVNDTAAEGAEAFGVEITAAYFNDAAKTPVTIGGTGQATGNIADDDAATPSAGTLRVPEDYATIQDAVNAARDGDTVLVSPGTYAGGIVISGKSITLTSHYDTVGDQSLVNQTIISGGAPAISVDASAPNTTVKGFHFVLSDYSVEFAARGGQALDNFFDDTNGDAVSFDSAGGVVRGNRFFSVQDDGVDVDAAMSNVLIENNTFEVTGNDGIEIRNFDYTGPHVTTTIRNNTIVGSREDGIQIIDYPGNSNRSFIIEQNLIRTSKYVGLGLMDNGATVEDFRAASMPERIHVFNNTFDGNAYAITGGDNLIAVNNIVSNSPVLGLKNIDAASTVAYTLFFGNAVNHSGSNIDASTTRMGDPLYTSTYGLRSGSPAIDSGTTSFVHNQQTVLDIPPSEYSGTTADLGWSEFGL